MQQQGKLTAKNFIKQSIERQKYECILCYEVCIKPVRCRGKCQQIFCMKCVSKHRINNEDTCPNRCSSPFLVDMIPQIQLQFYCPYNPTECPGGIYNLKQFDNHYSNCQFVSQQTLKYKELVNQYKCLNGHYLEFFISSYKEMISSYCKQCMENKVCRSFCRICEEYYCVQCRVPPCSKQGCPLSHSFNYNKISILNFVCDICQISSAVSNGGFYDDNLCNFILCQSCYNELPQKYDVSKPKSIVVNINTQCSCGSKLQIINTKGEMSICQSCKKNKECIKRCTNNCGKKYCLKCKLFDIYSDKTCLDDHQLVKIQKRALISQLMLQQKQPLLCMRCSQNKEYYYVDTSCMIRMCEECVQYSMQVLICKQRPVSLYCSKNHVLKYSDDKQDVYDVCVQCKKQKWIKLFCQICSNEDQLCLYCFQCRPILLQTCYFQHKLKYVELNHRRECHFCRARTKRFMNCSKCSLYVCKKCVDKNATIKKEEKKQMDMEQCYEKMQVEK